MTTTDSHPEPNRTAPDPEFEATLSALADLALPAPAGVGAGALVRDGLADAFAAIDSPVGRLWVAWNGLGVSAVEAAASGDAFATGHETRIGRPTHAAADLPTSLARAIERRLAGDGRARFALDLRGHTDFERAVWTKALDIPRGEVRPYGWVAAEIGRPRAVRAVGTALGHNPVPLIVPCHRVVRSDGMLGQYSLGGPQNKRTILAAEGLDPEAMEAEARRGVRFIGSSSTGIVCWPTCRDARRITPPRRIPFRSLGAALDAGFRPCHVCRPASLAGAAA
jgi:O-6-methylguanine DNA methyltransferase